MKMGCVVMMGDGWNSVSILMAGFDISVLTFRVLLPYCYIVCYGYGFDYRIERPVCAVALYY
jgi:hypothetical protein